jgi:hypothetical protein
MEVLESDDSFKMKFQWKFRPRTFRIEWSEGANTLIMQLDTGNVELPLENVICEIAKFLHKTSSLKNNIKSNKVFKYVL